MIQNVLIKNFKSIKELQIPCKKLNVFIGEPNSGKSNIIEALALKSQNAVGVELNKNIFRYKTIGDLFHDFNINTPIEITTDKESSILQYSVSENKIPDNLFSYVLDNNNPQQKERPVMIQHNGAISVHGTLGKTNIRYYEFRRLSAFQPGYMPHLSVPYGENLPGLLLANQEYKKWVSDFFQSKALTLTLKPTENDIAVSKFVDGEIYSYPYFSISETLQRVVFYNMAIKSNNNAVLLFDEPETNTFPFYTKFIAERIALDNNNQFFITTHNPYLLLSLIEKTEFKNLNVCITEMKKYETKIHILNEDQIGNVLDLNSDVFFNFNQIIGE
ncbi:MAG: AAA family ATPase [Chitinophagaceae bacterium]|nr:AAA family ATPase [Chitinophagaceae bacterium]